MKMRMLSSLMSQLKMLQTSLKKVLWMQLTLVMKKKKVFTSNLYALTFCLDFSDRLTRRKKAMYRTFVRRPPAMETNEYEMLPKDMTLEETPLQKLRRLMFEVQELNDDIEKSKVRK